MSQEKFASRCRGGINCNENFCDCLPVRPFSPVPFKTDTDDEVDKITIAEIEQICDELPDFTPLKRTRSIRNFQEKETPPIENKKTAKKQKITDWITPKQKKKKVLKSPPPAPVIKPKKSRDLTEIEVLELERWDDEILNALGK